MDFMEEELNIDAPKIILDSLKYSLYSGGKRLRGVIPLAMHNAFGGNIDEILPFAAALELIHTYSLIHDDLPAMDNDDLRRGQATNHIVFGDDIAILAGDGLLNLAFEIMLKYSSTKTHIKVMKEISNSSGVTGMIGGQVVDIKSDNTMGINDLNYIQKNKTGKLLKSAFLISPILLNKTENLNAIENIGCDYGLAFQILDDILDIESTTEILGKPVGSDRSNNKLTYVSYYGMEKAKMDYKILTDKIKNNTKSIFGENTLIFEIIENSIGRIN